MVLVVRNRASRPLRVGRGDVRDPEVQERAGTIRSAGGASVTAGLSSVGPPPTLRISQLLAIFKMTGSRSSTTVAPNTDR